MDLLFPEFLEAGLPFRMRDLPSESQWSPRRALPARSRAYEGMEQVRLLSFTPVDHPDERVQRIGFDLTDPYVEQCWSAVVGPTSTLLLRRMPVLWETGAPAEIEASELSRSLGLGGGTGDNSLLTRSMERLVRFRLARPTTTDAGLEVFRQVAPLAARQLDRVSQWTLDTHERLFSAHLERFDDLASHRANLSSVTARLDRIQYGTGRPTNGIAAHHHGLER